MEKEIVKKGVAEAEKNLRDKQIETVKQIVLKTLEKKEKLEKEKSKLKSEIEKIDEDIKILKADIEDLKQGRLDRIEERQQKAPSTKDTSVVVIIKEKIIEKETINPVVIPSTPINPWYQPYVVYWSSTGSSGDNITFTNGESINNSVAKFSTVGMYEVGDKVINLR